MTAPAAPITVTTPGGEVRGTVDGDGARFLGIPYAAPPIGSLRWAPPAPVAPWSGVRDATTHSPAAWQPVGGPLDGLVPGMGSAHQGDDHLSVNVWTPSVEGSAPVLVWIHGGAFSIGSSSLPVYDGRRLATATGSVVVSLNYRLGAFGFLLIDDPDATANVGLLDQVAALEWVRGSIAAFGGDPTRVTVFGESAGGGSVLSLLSMPRAVGLFRSAIVQSGATDLLLDRDRALAVTDAVARAAGLDCVDLDALRRLSPDAVLAAQATAAGELFATVGTMPFHPCIDGDVLPTDWLTASRTALNPVPAIIGTTRDEMDLFAMFDPAAATLDDDALRTRLRRTGRDVDTLIDAYAVTGTTVPPAVWRRVNTDMAMWLPAIRIAEARAEHAPTWMYRFDWEASAADMGAPHGVDIPFPFTTFDVDGWDRFVDDPDGAVALARTIQGAWASFARDGAPTLDGHQWPTYDGDRRATALFGRDVTITDDPNGAVRRAWS